MIQSLNRLAELLGDSSPGRLLMQAEIAREVGQMDSALRILAKPLLTACEPTAAELREWCQAGICELQPFTHANWRVGQTP